MSKTIRFVSILGLVAVAAASQAVSVFITGRATGFTSTTGTFSPTVTFNGSDTPFAGVATGSTITEILSGATSTAKYTGATAADTFTVSFNGTPDTTAPGASAFTSAGTITTATGAFAAYLNQSGITVASNANTATGLQQLTISGNVTPEPASLAALGVGAVALLRRRRKA